MLAIEIRTGGLESGKDEDETFKDALYELSKTSPKAVEAQLAQDGQVLEVLDEKLNAVTSSVNTLATDVMERLDELKRDITELKEKAAGGQNQQRDDGRDGLVS